MKNCNYFSFRNVTRSSQHILVMNSTYTHTTGREFYHVASVWNNLHHYKKRTLIGRIVRGIAINVSDASKRLQHRRDIVPTWGSMFKKISRDCMMDRTSLMEVLIHHLVAARTKNPKVPASQRVLPQKVMLQKWICTRKIHVILKDYTHCQVLCARKLSRI